MGLTDKWTDRPDYTYCVKAEFADGSVSYTTIEHAADRLDFIDRERGVSDLIDGVAFRSHMGTTYTVVPADTLR
jgi:hypothetical protein